MKSTYDPESGDLSVTIPEAVLGPWCRDWGIPENGSAPTGVDIEAALSDLFVRIALHYATYEHPQS